MKLLKTPSDRKDPKNNPYIDLYLGWKHDGKTYCVRVRPVFACDNRKLLSEAITFEGFEELEKYLD